VSETRLIPIALIVPPPEPMRIGFNEDALMELAQNIKARGLINSLTVYPELKPNPQRDDMTRPELAVPALFTGRYIIAAGHRRYLACRMIGMLDVLCSVREGTADDYEADMVSENAFRTDLTPLEEGNRYKEISLREGMSEDRLRALCGGKPLSHIYARIRLVEGDPDISLAVHEGRISLAVAAELNRVCLAFYKSKLGELTPEQEAIVERDAARHRKYLLQLACDSGTSKNQAHSWIVQWELEVGLMRPPDAVPMQPAPQAPPVGFVPRCFLCGQDDRPYDLENVYICRAELRAIKVAYDKPIEAT
jgi:ParB/RepB/Spo0J family partition protein